MTRRKSAQVDAPGAGADGLDEPPDEAGAAVEPPLDCCDPESLVEDDAPSDFAALPSDLLDDASAGLSAAGAVSWRAKPLPPHEGHSVSGASEIFCS